MYTQNLSLFGETFEIYVKSKRNGFGIVEYQEKAIGIIHKMDEYFKSLDNDTQQQNFRILVDSSVKWYFSSNREKTPYRYDETNINTILCLCSCLRKYDNKTMDFLIYCIYSFLVTIKRNSILENCKSVFPGISFWYGNPQLDYHIYWDEEKKERVSYSQSIKDVFRIHIIPKEEHKPYLPEYYVIKNGLTASFQIDKFYSNYSEMDNILSTIEKNSEEVLKPMVKKLHQFGEVKIYPPIELIDPKILLKQ